MGDENYYNEGNISYPCASWAPILGFLGCASAIVFASKFGRAREEWPTKKRAVRGIFSLRRGLSTSSYVKHGSNSGTVGTDAKRRERWQRRLLRTRRQTSRPTDVMAGRGAGRGGL